jgi:hypothetical protein
MTASEPSQTTETPSRFQHQAKNESAPNPFESRDARSNSPPPKSAQSHTSGSVRSFSFSTTAGKTVPYCFSAAYVESGPVTLQAIQHQTYDPPGPLREDQHG